MSLDTALVTGGAGFVGSHVVRRFLEGGADVHVIDNLVTGNRDNLPPGVPFHEMDVASEDARRLVKDLKPKLLIHLAANSRVRTSLKDPIFDYASNIEATLNLLRAAAENGLKQMIFFSTGGAIYGDKPNLPISEEESPDPDSFYGVSKLTGEKLVGWFSANTDAAFTILRPSNIYGERQRPDLEAGVISIFINRMLNNDDVIIFGDGNQTRDFIYVGDVVNAVKHVADGRIAGVFNVCTGIETGINGLFNALARKLGYKKSPGHGEPIPGELRRNLLSCAKLRSTGWNYAVSLDDGLDRTIHYLRGENERIQGLGGNRS